MLKAVIFEPEKIKVSITHYKRLSSLLSKEFQIPIINSKAFLFYNEKIRKILYIGGRAFSSQFKDLNEINNFVKRHPESEFFWITTEYNLSLHPTIKKNLNSYTIIANHQRKEQKCIQVNLNALIYREYEPQAKEYQIIYHGTFRPNRKQYFKKYFDEDFVISTSKKNIFLFKELGIKSKFIEPFSWKSKTPILSRFKFSLYIEDIYTHTHYNYPACRFYEALGCSVIQLFDVNCLNTFKIAGYDISDFIVKNREKLKKKMKEIEKNYDLYLSKQLEWREKARQEKEEALEQFREILEL